MGGSKMNTSSVHWTYYTTQNFSRNQLALGDFQLILADSTSMGICLNGERFFECLLVRKSNHSECIVNGKITFFKKCKFIVRGGHIVFAVSCVGGAI